MFSVDTSHLNLKAIFVEPTTSVKNTPFVVIGSFQFSILKQLRTQYGKYYIFGITFSDEMKPDHPID